MNPKKIGKRIKMMREKEGWSKQELARRAGLHHNTISDLEKGRYKTISLEVLDSLAKAFYLPTCAFICEVKH